MGVQGIVVRIQMHRGYKLKIFVPVRNRFAALLARFRLAREAAIRLVSAFELTDNSSRVRQTNEWASDYLQQVNKIRTSELASQVDALGGSSRVPTRRTSAKKSGFKKSFPIVRKYQLKLKRRLSESQYIGAVEVKVLTSQTPCTSSVGTDTWPE